MELKSRITMAFLLILVLSRPMVSQGRPNMMDLNNEVYEIDYRGPETHWYVPPPDRSGGGNPFIHHESVMPRNKFKGPRSHKVGRDEKTIHG